MINVNDLSTAKHMTRSEQSIIKGGIFFGKFNFPTPVAGRPWCGTGLPTIFGRRGRNPIIEVRRF